MNVTKKMTTITMLLAISILFSLVESMIPIPLPIPGFKLGLANIVGLITLYMFGGKVMIEINFMRVIFVSLLRGTLLGTGFWVSLCGLMVSTIITILAYKKSPMTIYGVSVAGSVTHSIGQVIVITLIYNQFFMQAILPALIILAIPTGLGMALISKAVLIRMKVVYQNHSTI